MPTTTKLASITDHTSAAAQPSAEILAAREKRRLESERRKALQAQIPAGIELYVKKILGERWDNEFKAAAEAVLAYRLGEPQLRRIVEEFVAHDVRCTQPEYVEVDGLPFRDFARILIAPTDTGSYRIREQLLRGGKLEDTAGVFDAHNWPPISRALQHDPGYSIWRTNRLLRTHARVSEREHTNIVLQPGLNVIPAALYEGFMDRVEVDAWIEDGVIERV